MFINTLLTIIISSTRRSNEGSLPSDLCISGQNINQVVDTTHSLLLLSSTRLVQEDYLYTTTQSVSLSLPIKSSTSSINIKMSTRSKSQSSSSSPIKKKQHHKINAYSIFLILERQRNCKLRELYRSSAQRRVTTELDDCKTSSASSTLPSIAEESVSAAAASSSCSGSSTKRHSSLRIQQAVMKKFERAAAQSTSSSSNIVMSALPKFPPRYQALASNMTSDVLMTQLRSSSPSPPTSTTTASSRSCSNNRLHRSQTNSSSSSSSSPATTTSYMEEYKNLDQVTKQFLNDTAHILQHRCNEEEENNEMRLEINVRSSIEKNMKGVMDSSGGSKTTRKWFTFRAERKLSLIID